MTGKCDIVRIILFIIEAQKWLGKAETIAMVYQLGSLQTL